MEIQPGRLAHTEKAPPTPISTVPLQPWRTWEKAKQAWRFPKMRWAAKGE